MSTVAGLPSGRHRHYLSEQRLPTSPVNDAPRNSKDGAARAPLMEPFCPLYLVMRRQTWRYLGIQLILAILSVCDTGFKRHSKSYESDEQNKQQVTHCYSYHRVRCNSSSRWTFLSKATLLVIPILGFYLLGQALSYSLLDLSILPSMSLHSMPVCLKAYSQTYHGFSFWQRLNKTLVRLRSAAHFEFNFTNRHGRSFRLAGCTTSYSRI